MTAREKHVKFIEDILGVPFRDAQKTHSRDQLIGIFRELEDGKDPYKKERRNIGEELERAGILMSSPKEMYRDERDTQIWMMFITGEVMIPPSERMAKNFDIFELAAKRNRIIGNK